MTINDKLFKTWLDIEDLFKDKSVHSVVGFGRVPGKQRVKITRVAKNRDTFLIVRGNPNYAEREYLKRCKRKGVVTSELVVRRKGTK